MTGLTKSKKGEMMKTLTRDAIFSAAIVLLIIPASYAADQNRAIKIVNEKCHLCHGHEGEASNVVYPRLAGQNKKYIVKQLTDFREKRRLGTMNDMANGLTNAEIGALADYFSAKPTLVHKIRNAELAAVGHYIFNHGNQYSDIPACASCHGVNGEGTDILPRLAGQHKHYVVSQLEDFSSQDRINEIMNSIASKLTELEREAVALYVSGLK